MKRGGGKQARAMLRGIRACALLLLIPFAAVAEEAPATTPTAQTAPGPDESATPAPAEEAPVVDTSPAGVVRAWIASIDATVEWEAGVKAVDYDSSGDNLVIAGLSVHAKRGGLDIDFDKITLKGYAASADGGFRAAEIKVEGGTATAGFVKIGVSDVDLRDVSVPAIAPVVYDASRPFTSQLDALAGLAKATMAEGHAGVLSILQTVDGINSRIAYNNLTIEKLADGKIASVRAGPLTMQSPAPEGLAGISIASAETADVDLNAFLRVYDPDQYAGGVGDLAWHDAIARTTYRDFLMELPGIKISIAGIGMEKLSLRQPKSSFADYLDRRMTRPAGVANDQHDPRDDAGLASMISAFGLGRFSLDKFKVEADGIDKFGFDGFHVSGLSSDAIAEIGLDGFAAGIESQGNVEIGHFLVGNMTLPGAEATIAALRGIQQDQDVDFSALAPTVGHVEMDGLKVDIAELMRVALGRMRIDLANYVGRFPASISMDIAGFDAPTQAIPNRLVSQLLGSFGIDRVEADLAMKLAWNENEQKVDLKDFRVALKDQGVLTGSAAMAGLSREALEQSGSVLDALPRTTFTAGTFAFKDESLIEKGLAFRAKSANADPEKLRKQLATALPFMLGFLGNPAFQKQVGPVLKAFLLKPGTITATLAPPAPVTISEIAKTIRSAPQDLPNLLGITVTGDSPLPTPEPTPVKSEAQPLEPVTPSAPAEPQARPGTDP